jgi:hypothetical protein
MTAINIVRNYKYQEQVLFCDRLLSLCLEKNGNANVINSSWAIIKKLNWTIKSEGEIDADVLGLRIREIGIESLRRSFRSIAEFLLKKYTFFDSIEKRIFINLVALGEDVINSVVETPELLEFFILEMQPIDLESIFRPY